MRATVALLLVLPACTRASAPARREPGATVASASAAPPREPPPVVDAAPETCHSASDCAAGELCCRSRLTPNGQSCMQPDTVDGEPCMLQACLAERGAPCPSGQACRDGFCRPFPHERATCNGVRCPADRPSCRWDGTKAACAAEGGLACTKKADCGPGMHCCASDPMSGAITNSECARDCAPPSTEDLCEKDSDCPPLYATGADHGLKPRPCAAKPGPGSPPWIRMCGNAP